MSRVLLVLLIAFLALGVFAWATDKVTSQGERTIYTADCVQGKWLANRCTGKLVAAKRYRFRALKAHGEVLFWTLGEQGPSGKYTECSILDGHNWVCNANPDALRTIVHQMLHGRPVLDPAVPMIAFHQIPKWKWVLLRVGVPVGHEASS